MKNKTFLRFTMAMALCLWACPVFSQRISGDSVRVAPAIIHKYAQLLGVADSTIVHPELYALIDGWMGTPYKYGGNTKKGTDCSGFVGQVMKDCSSAALPRSAAEMAHTVTPRGEGQLQEGDLVFFHYGKKAVGHVGIYLQNGWFVHSSSYRGGGVTLGNLRSGTYKSRFVKGGSVDLDKLRPQELAGIPSYQF